MKTSLTLFASTTLIAAVTSSAFAQEPLMDTTQPAQPTVQPAANTVIVVTPAAPTVVSAPGSVPPGPAQPAAAPSARPAITDPDISHLGGQLVPVGTQNEYRYSFRKTNIAMNPIGWLTGFYGISASHAVSNNIAIRGDVTVIDGPFGNDGTTGADISLSAVVYMRRTYLGPFIEPGLRVLSFGNEQCDYAYSQNGSGESNCSSRQEMSVGPQVLLGYHYSYDSGFNVAIAGGLSRTLSSDSEYDDDEILPAGYVRFGYSF